MKSSNSKTLKTKDPVNWVPKQVEQEDIEKFIESGSFKKQVQGLSNEGLKSAVEDRSAALKSAREIIGKIEPESLTEEHINTIADGIQFFAKTLWEKRVKKY